MWDKSAELWDVIIRVFTDAQVSKLTNLYGKQSMST